MILFVRTSKDLVARISWDQKTRAEFQCVGLSQDSFTEINILNGIKPVVRSLRVRPMNRVRECACQRIVFVCVLVCECSR